MYSLFLQSGSYDCGLFAIAFATEVAHSKDPGACRFEQCKMRKHLFKCIRSGTLTPFPQQRRLSGGGVKTRDDIEVHCWCRMPELKDFTMIECTSCIKWFHIFCDDANICEENMDDTNGCVESVYSYFIEIFKI